LAGAVVLCTLILMGVDIRMFLDVHAAIVIFGGSFAATLIRFPLFFDLSWITARGKIRLLAAPNESA
jgi:flagellar motor component MotA